MGITRSFPKDLLLCREILSFFPALSAKCLLTFVRENCKFERCQMRQQVTDTLAFFAVFFNSAFENPVNRRKS
jgi:hypothetical protein